MKLQNALEYLSVYGWAIIIIGVALATLYALGVFSPSHFVSSQCFLPAGLYCSSFYLFTNGLLKVNLLQTTQAPINITALGCNENGTAYDMQQPYNPPTGQITLPIGSNYTFSVQCYNGASYYSGSIGDMYSGYLLINYTDITTGFPQVAYGKIVAKVSAQST